MFTRAIVRPPAPNFTDGLTTAGLGAPDYERATGQHEAYCAALEQCGLILTRLQADSDFPDSTFVEDAAILLEGLHDRPASGESAVITRPGAASRLGEILSIRQALNDFFPALHEINSPGTVDGGDVCQAGNHFFIGVSERTNESGARQLADIVARLDYKASRVDIRNVEGLLHLKSGLAYLGDDRLVVTEGLADHPEFAGYELVRVEPPEDYAANCVRLNDHVVVAAGFPAFERTVRRFGYQTIILDMSEFRKMDGGLSCLSLRF